jgi:hypothetical protein
MPFRAFVILVALLAATPCLAATIAPQEAARHVGETATVQGVAYVHVKSSATFFDMGGDFPNQSFQAVVFPNRASGFGDLTRYNGRVISVTGRIREYKGAPEIVLESPDQLKFK